MHLRRRGHQLEQARAELTAYVEHYHHHPHSGLNYRTPAEVAATWGDGHTRLTHPA